MSVRSTSILLLLVLTLVLSCPPSSAHPQQRRGEGGGGGTCTLTVSPAYLNVANVGGTHELTVNTDDMYCSWEVTTADSWIVPNVTSGSGSGSVSLSIASAPSSQTCVPRFGIVTINTMTIVVSQSGYYLVDCVGDTSDIGGNNDCCAAKAASLVSRGGDSLSLARRYRDEVLRSSPLGAEYVRAYYDHTGEAVQIASADPWLLLRTARALKRHTETLRRAVEKRDAVITSDDLAEFDALAAEYEAAAGPALRAKLASFRRDLRNPTRLAGVGVRLLLTDEVDAAKRSEDLDVDGFDERLVGLAPTGAGIATRLVRVPDMLAVAARTRHYARWFEHEAPRVLEAITADPALAMRFGITASRLMSTLDGLVETGTASIDQSSLDELGELIDRVAGRLGPDAATTLRLARRDLRSRQLLSAVGVSIDRVRFAHPGVPIPTTKAAGTTAGPSGFLGGAGDDIASATTTDAAGNIIIVGATAGAGFPVVNAVQSPYRGEGDAFVTKLAPDGQVLFSTYLGGTRADVASAVATDATGNIYVCGTTESTNFPVVGGYQRALRGAADGFVVKLDPTGSSIVYGTYLGGTSMDGATGIAIDATGRAFITGATTSTNFPVTNGVVDRVMTGLVDAFVARLSSSGASLEASCFLGGQGRDGASSIGVDAAGNIVVAGVTSSLDFPQVRPVQPDFGGVCDGFVAKLGPGLSNFVFSSWLGGSDIDGVGGLAVDATGSVVVTGATASATDFPLRSALQASYGGGLLDAFVARVPSNGGSLDVSTFLGGSDDDRGYRIALAESGAIAVAGITASADFTSASPVQPSFGGGSFDAFVTQLAPSGTTVRLSTFVGGSSDEAGVGLAMHPTGAILAVGETSSSNLPVSSALGGFGGGPCDGFIVSVGGAPQVPPPVVDGVTALTQPGKPFRVRIVGSNFQSGALVYIGGSPTPWASVKRKGESQLLLRKGAALEAVFPVGAPTGIRIVNPDGGVVTVAFTR